jgi:hypothetical protein
MTETEEEHELMGCEWEIEVRDKDGNITDHKKGENSLLTQMISLIGGGMDTNVVASSMGKYIGNTTCYGAYWGPSAGNTASGPSCNAGANLTTHGILIGTDNTAVVVDDYKINTLIAQGVGAGQMQYQAMVVNAVVTSAPRSSMRLDRTMTNNSGGAITVKEIALYCLGYDSSAAYTSCVCRDVIPDTVVANGSSIFVKYTLYVTT